MGLRGALPAILTGISVATAIGSVLLAIHETPEAVRMLDDHRLEIDPTGETDLAPMEKVKDYTKAYWPTALCLTASVATGIASCVISQRRIKGVLISAAGVSAAYAKYKDKVAEIIGEEKEKLIEKAVADDIHKEKKLMMSTNPTELVWFHDPITDTDFQMTMNDYWAAKYYAQTNLGFYGEVKLGDIFYHSTLAKETEDKKALEDMWFVDDLLENFGYPVLSIDEEAWNFPGTENADKQDMYLNHGRPTWVIRYGMWPLPPAVAKDYQYIGSEG